MAIFSKERPKKNRRRSSFSYKSNLYPGKSQRKIIKRVILLIALSVAFFFSFSLLNQSITKIQYVTEMKRVSIDDLRGISSKIYDEGFLQINLSDIKEEIEQVNWVKSVSLERRWPDQINITIEEEDIVGWWNKDSIINSKGNLFLLDHQSLPSGLIEFNGPKGILLPRIAESSALVWALVHVSTKELSASLCSARAARVANFASLQSASPPMA